MWQKGVLPSLVVLAVASLAGRAADEHLEAGKAAAKHAGFQRFTRLAGEWTGKEVAGLKGKGDVRVLYKVTSGGTAVMETLFPGTDHEMVTVIHPDGKALVLTHYCAVGNQPHMKAENSGHGNKVDFAFTGASNLKSPNDMHMHNVSYTFVDNDTLRADWMYYRDGQKAGMVTFELKRSK
jgi:hypothetical protein